MLGSHISILIRLRSISSSAFVVCFHLILAERWGFTTASAWTFLLILISSLILLVDIDLVGIQVSALAVLYPLASSLTIFISVLIHFKFRFN